MKSRVALFTSPSLGVDTGTVFGAAPFLSQHTYFLLFIYLFIYFILQWILSYIEMKQPWVYMCSPSRSLLPPPSPPAPSRSSQCTRSERLSHASNLGWRSASPQIIYTSMLFSRNIPPPPSPTESKRLFYKSVSLFLFCIQGYP